MRPEPLPMQVHLGLRLASRQGVDEKPPLVPLEGQALPLARTQCNPLPLFLGLTGSLGRRRQGPRLILVNGPNRGISWPNYGISFGVAEGSRWGVQYRGRGRIPLI